MDFAELAQELINVGIPAFIFLVTLSLGYLGAKASGIFDDITNPVVRQTIRNVIAQYYVRNYNDIVDMSLKDAARFMTTRVEQLLEQRQVNVSFDELEGMLINEIEDMSDLVEKWALNSREDSENVTSE